MARIRIALIGLSSRAKTSWAAEAHLPYFLSDRGSTHYEIVALLNSSIASAAEARSHYGLNDSVRLFEDPEALARDPDIDLIVCNTRSDVHFPTVQPSLAAGKRVFVEWPLAESLDRAVELTQGHSLRQGIIGLQCRHFPVIKKIKALLDSGTIGRILSSSVAAYGTVLPRDAYPETLDYFADRKVGGNPMTIGYAHMIDYVHDVLGEFESFQGRMQTQRPDLGSLASDGTSKPLSSDVPDFVAVHGRLRRGRRPIVEDATLAVTFRQGPQFPGTPGFEWTINGEKGEIRVTTPGGPYLQPLVLDQPFYIKVHDHATDTVTDVAWDWENWQESLPLKARNTADVFEKYATWVESGEKADPSELPEEDQWPTLDDSMVRMREIGELFSQYDQQG